VRIRNDTKKYNIDIPSGQYISFNAPTMLKTCVELICNAKKNSSLAKATWQPLCGSYCIEYMSKNSKQTNNVLGENKKC
jgi:hypothetical protein